MPRSTCVLLIGVAIVVTNCLGPSWGADKKASAKSAKDSDITEFLSSIDKVQTPEAVLLALNGYLTTNELTDKQVDRMQKAIEKYSEYAENGLRRYGGKWRKPDEINQLANQAEDYIRQAFDELKAQNPKKTLEYLNRASTVDPGGIRADFIVGMLYCLRGNANPKLAAERFEAVLKRVPNYGPARNNLAISQIKLLKPEKYGEAYANFRQAAESMPNSLQVLQNVNRVVREAEQGQLPLPVAAKNKPDDAKRFAKFTKLAAQLNESAAKRNQRFDAKVGWLYCPFIDPNRPPVGQNDERPVPDPNQPFVPVARGTGFLVAPGYLLTNRHVVTDDALGVADQVAVRRTNARGDNQTWTTKNIIYSANQDLALLHVPDADGTPISLVEKPAPRGREVLVLGYPVVDLLGDSLKVTRGVITGLPDGKRFGGMLLMDAEANPGNSGGPVCDRSGQLIGVLTAVHRLMDYSLAIPASEVAAFAAKQQIELPAEENLEEAADWSIIDERLSSSVYLVETSYQASSLQFRDLLPDELRPVRSEYEDNSCANCSGRGHKACRAPGCVAGANLETTYDSAFMRTGASVERVVTGSNLRVSNCRVCRGSGRIECTICKGKGIDPDLR